MLELYRSLTVRQYEAALRMLYQCVVQCDDEAWDARVHKYPVCQVVFHTLLFTDVYLVDDVEAMQAQRFHQDNAAYFADYIEFKNEQAPIRYDHSLTQDYLLHCRDLAQQVLANETEQSLAVRSQLSWMGLIRAELHIYNIRHIHHHAAQLSLHLRKAGVENVPWVGSGWKDLE